MIFSNTDSKDFFDLVDGITSDVEVNHVLFEHELIDMTSSGPPEPDPRLDFPDTLFKYN